MAFALRRLSPAVRRVLETTALLGRLPVERGDEELGETA